jgi:hypothetical protein
MQSTTEQRIRDLIREANNLEILARDLKAEAKRLREDPRFCVIHLGGRPYAYLNTDGAEVGDYVAIRLPSGKIEAHTVRELGKGGYTGTPFKRARLLETLV